MQGDSGRRGPDRGEDKSVKLHRNGEQFHPSISLQAFKCSDMQYNSGF